MGNNINYAKSENNKTINYCDKASRKINFFEKKAEVGIDEFEKGTRLSKDDKGARVNARIDSMRKGEEFDESDTPEEELETIDYDIVDELINREIDNIFSD
jgi:hypothetical protein